MHSQCRTVTDVLEGAESELGLVTSTVDRCACIDQPAPTSPGDWLALWEDEAEIQKDNADEAREAGRLEDSEQMGDYAGKILEFCDDLRELGTHPSLPPWNRV